MADTRNEVVMYWRPGCPICRKLRLKLFVSRLRYRKVNIWKDPDAAAFVRSVANGNETVPTVTVAGQALVNPNRQDLLAVVRERAPEALPSG
jgi:glutaredoxin-like protein